MMVSDRAIGSLLMKYNETDWQFALRMAGKLGAPLVADLCSSRPQLYIGLPPARKTVRVDSRAFSFGSDDAGFGGEQVETEEYAYIGDQVCLNGGRNKYIRGVHAYLSDGIMHIKYELMDDGDSGAGSLSGSSGTGTGSASGIAAPAAASQASGKMMKGIVKAVSGDKVQVHLTDVDKSYDGGGYFFRREMRGKHLLQAPSA